MKILLDKWQEEILDLEGDLLLCTGRRVGKTYIFARKAAERMVKQKGCEIVAVSLTEDQAQIMHAMVLGHLAYMKIPLKQQPTRNVIKLTNGSIYTVRPVGNTGDAIRGFNAHVLIVDEASRIPESAWVAARPTLLTTGGEIWLCSTPFGKSGYFYESWADVKERNDADARYKVFHISSEEVIYNRPISESWKENQRNKAIRNLEKEKKDMSELQYGQEYLGLFMEELMRYFDDDWIDRVCIRKKEEKIPKQADFYLGVDIARLGGDETSFEVIQRVSKDILLHVYNETEIRWLTTKTEERIMELDRLFSFKKIYIDAGAGSLGVGIFDHLLREDQTKRKVEAINNRKLVLDREGKSKQKLLKEDLYDNLRNLGQKGQINLLDDEKVRMSLRSVQYEFVQKTNSLSQLRIFGNYTHIVEGLIRAAWCSKEKHLNFNVFSIKI